MAIDPTKPGPLPDSIGALVDESTGTPFSNTNPNITVAGGFFTDPTKGNATLFAAPPTGFTANDFSSVSETSTYTQIAPTTLEALGLDPSLLTGAKQDGTTDLNGLLSNTLAVGSNNIINLPGGSGSLQFNLNSNDQRSLNEFGVFEVDDANGDITDSSTGKTYKPGDPLYTQEALKESKIIYGLDPVASRDRTTNLQGQFFQSGKRLGFYLIQNGTSNQELAALDNKTANKPNIYFSIQSANSDS